MTEFQKGDPVHITAPNHRKHNHYGTVTSDGPGHFMGSYTVLIDGAEYGIKPSELRLMTPAEHYPNYQRYKAQQDALPRPFTDSQKPTPLQYLPYARYPITNQGVGAPTPQKG